MKASKLGRLPVLLLNQKVWFNISNNMWNKENDLFFVFYPAVLFQFPFSLKFLSADETFEFLAEQIELHYYW